MSHPFQGLWHFSFGHVLADSRKSLLLPGKDHTTTEIGDAGSFDLVFPLQAGAMVTIPVTVITETGLPFFQGTTVLDDAEYHCLGILLIDPAGSQQVLGNVWRRKSRGPVYDPEDTGMFIATRPGGHEDGEGE
jgi:hypothetical protein